MWQPALARSAPRNRGHYRIRSFGLASTSSAGRAAGPFPRILARRVVRRRGEPPRRRAAACRCPRDHAGDRLHAGLLRGPGDDDDPPDARPVHRCAGRSLRTVPGGVPLAKVRRLLFVLEEGTTPRYRPAILRAARKETWPVKCLLRTVTVPVVHSSVTPGPGLLFSLPRTRTKQDQLGPSLRAGLPLPARRQAGHSRPNRQSRQGKTKTRTNGPRADPGGDAVRC